MIKKIFTSSFFFLSLAFIFSTVARAEDIVISISGNGSSSNTVEADVSTTTTVEQSNDAQITNNVNNNSDTGGNETSSNSGDANIQTGSANSTTDVNNQNINQNTAVIDGCGCASDVIKASVDGNGDYSGNSINLSILNSTDVVQANSAYILNNVGVYANTGNNIANSNNGNVSIQTGNITTLIDILNKNINQNFDPAVNNSSAVSVLISGNGNYSVNDISLLFNNIFNFESRNFAEIINNVIVDANTGGNVANKNNGSILIATGDIVSVVNIGNENINSSFVSVDNCNCSPTPPGDGDGDGETPPVGGNPGTTPSSNGGGGNGSSVGGGAGQVLGAAIGAVLPATGSYLMLLMTLLSIIMFAVGWYLRFGSDISPPAYAIS